ncbi:uncharacterized protein [Chelonus insularis]|uniref:uncharacterized protein n=1 Tax=Chelonus insularis TaxID=460826 RepID=UPI00158B4F4D|nr:uncharacterized protein LOC118074655 [Chelonus insularis]
MASFCQVSDLLTCRHVLNIMVISGFMLNYMMRVNLIISIVSMVVPSNSSSNSSYISHECSDPSQTINTGHIDIYQLSSNNTDNIFNSSKVQVERPQTRYEWDEYEVNFVLGTFFWGYLCTEVPGGRLAEVIGAKKVLGIAMFTTSIISLLTPFAASLGYQVVAALRVVVGFMLGASWPALFPLAAQWIPPTERSKFMSHTMASTLGAAVMMQIGGFLIANLGWESVFYFTGGISCVWSIIWFSVVYDSPAQHPRISIEERRYIEEAIGNASSHNKKKIHAVPWKSIFTSKPVWAIILYGTANAFSFFTILTQLPTYMKYILDYRIQENGILSSLPYIGQYFVGLSSAIIADHLYHHNKLSVTAIRKIFNAIGGLAPGICMISLALFGCNRNIAVTAFTLALTCNGAIGGGFFGNALDIAPNFSGTIFGIANTLSSLGGYLSSVMVGCLTYNNQTYKQWQIVFWVLAGMYIFQSVIFLLLGSGVLQPWNNPDNNYLKRKIEPNDMKDEEEGISLNKVNELYLLTCRHVLNIMIILGFICNYILRVNLTIAIVAMVVPRNSTSTNLTYVSDEYSETLSAINSTATNTSQSSLIIEFNYNDNDSYSSDLKLEHKRLQTRYNWDEYEVNLILGAFFWGYICTELPGGRLAEIVGAKRVFGYSMLSSSIITLLTPLAASFGYAAMAALRIALGLMLGATWPALYPLISLWIPPTERSKFVANTLAATLGAAFIMQVGGYLIEFLGWESVFYFTGGISCAWSIIWFMVVYDSPAQHPRISVEERKKIEDAIGPTSLTKTFKVPWKSILTSKPVWAIIIYGACTDFGFFTILTQLPTYMKYILNYEIKENGLLCSLLFIGQYFFGLLSAIIADYLHRKRICSVTTIRKVFNTIASIIPGLCMIILAKFGCDRVIAVTVFTIASTTNGAVTAGFLGNSLDIAPNFSGTIYGLVNTACSLAGYLSSLMVGSLTLNNQTYGQWQIIFWILAGLYVFEAVVFLILGSGEVQEWNYCNDNLSKKKIKLNKINNQEEAVPLKNDI